MHPTPRLLWSLLPLIFAACATRSPSSTHPGPARESQAATPASEPPPTASVPESPPVEPLPDATTDEARDALRRAPVPPCLHGRERVVVTGYFDAESGALHVERSEPSPGLRPAASSCVTRALNASHVLPGGGRHDFYWTFGARDALASPEGQIDARQVTASIRERLSQIRACYERQWRAQPGLRGRVRVWFTANTEGVITRSITRASSAELADVGACIMHQIRGAAMPRATGGDIEFMVPFTFGPDSVAGGAPVATSPQ